MIVPVISIRRAWREGDEIGIDSNMVQDLFDNILWDSGNGDHLGFRGDECLGCHSGDVSPFRGVRTGFGGTPWVG